jgi:hypothetical protein
VLKDVVRRRTGLLREPILILLSLTLLASGLVANARKGARIIVTNRDGQVFQGELLAVTGENLTFLDQSTSSEVTKSLQDIKTITIVKNKSKKVGELVAGALVTAPCSGCSFFRTPVSLIPTPIFT